MFVFLVLVRNEGTSVNGAVIDNTLELMEERVTEFLNTHLVPQRALFDDDDTKRPDRQIEFSILRREI